MKLTSVVQMGRSKVHGNLEVGKKLNFVAERRRDYSAPQNVFNFSEIPFKDTGKLELVGDVHSFCLGDFARTMGLTVRELKAIFPINSISKVKITIQVSDTEEWEYTK